MRALATGRTSVYFCRAPRVPRHKAFRKTHRADSRGSPMLRHRSVVALIIEFTFSFACDG
eukprot:2011052-Alexandrium_andersonii.AAC.1